MMEWRDDEGNLHIKVTCIHCQRYIEVTFEETEHEKWKKLHVDYLHAALQAHSRRKHFKEPSA